MAKKTCEKENSTLGLPEEPEHTLQVPVWINLMKKEEREWKADGGLNKSMYQDHLTILQTFTCTNLVLNT